MSILHAMAKAKAANTTSSNAKENVPEMSPPTEANAPPSGASDAGGLREESGGEWTCSALARLPTLCEHCADKPANSRASRRARKSKEVVLGRKGTVRALVI